MRVAFRRFLSGLEGKVLVLTFAALLAVAVPSATAFFFIVDATVIRLGTLFAEKQILFDRYRGLESLMREVSLAETVARSPAIVDWAGDEQDADKTRRGLAELEHYRLSFKDMSYFVVLGGTGNYYFNDRANAYADNQLRYTLSPDNPRDGWYYKTVARGSGCHLNVDHDDNLGVTKVWINCVISGTDGKALGIIGTGVDLSRFIREVVDIPQNGVQSIFVDRSGAVQAHRDPRLVDFHSLTKDLKAKKTVYGLLASDADRAKLNRMMQEVAAGSAPVRSAFLEVEGKKTLVGVGYLNQLGWYNVTLMDVDTIIETYQHFKGRARMTFGWGTNLTNDFEDCAPTPTDRLDAISLVCKVVDANGRPVVKLSDNPEKATGDAKEIERYTRLFGEVGRSRRLVKV